MRASLLLVLLGWSLTVQASSLVRRDTAAVIRQQFGNFKPNCFPRPSGGCKCNVVLTNEETVEEFDSDADCKLPLEVQTAQNKKKLNEEIKEKFGDFKENCFPRPSGGCKCNEKNAAGEETVVTHDAASQCRVGATADPVRAEAAANKAEVNEEIKQKFGNFKENCFPKPSGGCKCNEKDKDGNEIVATYNADAQCKVPAARVKRATVTGQQPDRATQIRDPSVREKSPVASQNVRDPVREKAQENYRAVVNELNEKFRGLKEGCFPRPKGCLCVIGKTAEGRDITERRMKDVDCKCQAGDRSPGCPAA